MAQSKPYVAPNGKIYVDTNFYSWHCSLLILGIYPEKLLPRTDPIDEAEIVIQEGVRFDFLTDH